MTIHEAQPLCQVKGYVITRDEKDGQEFIVYKNKRDKQTRATNIMSCLHAFIQGKILN